MEYVFDRETKVLKFTSEQPNNDAHIRSWAGAQADLVQVEINSTSHRSADEYFYLKDRLRHWAAKSCGMTARQYDPVGAWHGMQSN